jgi:hexosaminidase
VGGGVGGFYTQAAYKAIVEYARERFVTIVPEIDVPGHTNAALASYPDLTCDGVAPALFTGTRVGFSALCVDKEPVYAFLDDVVREIAAITPGAWFHIGGDEVRTLTSTQYRNFVKRVEAIVTKHGKRMVGWADVAPVNLLPTTVVQHWSADSMSLHVARGGRVILSPASRLYLDMRYDSTTALGLDWAGRSDVRDAYDWEPAGFHGVPDAAILGVESPLWSETLVKRSDVEYMAFPRLIALAEVGWSSRASRRWDSFRVRLGEHGARLTALGVNFYRSPQIPWRR